MRAFGLNVNILRKMSMASAATPGKCKPLPSRAAKERMYLFASSPSCSMSAGSGGSQEVKDHVKRVTLFE